jgi:hypothetical protein
MIVGVIDVHGVFGGAGDIFGWNQELLFTHLEKTTGTDLEKANFALVLIDKQGTDMTNVFTFQINHFVVANVFVCVIEHQVGVAKFDEHVFLHGLGLRLLAHVNSWCCDLALWFDAEVGVIAAYSPRLSQYDLCP